MGAGGWAPAPSLTLTTAYNCSVLYKLENIIIIIIIIIIALYQCIYYYQYKNM